MAVAKFILIAALVCISLFGVYWASVDQEPIMMLENIEFFEDFKIGQATIPSGGVLAIVGGVLALAIAKFWKISDVYEQTRKLPDGTVIFEKRSFNRVSAPQPDDDSEVSSEEK